jgi:DNA-binding transcriptional regulator YdaS (Cro superfamily)
MTKVAEAINLLGGPAKAARALGVSIQAASFWRSGHRTFPADLCISVEKLTEGRVRCEELRPDVDWAYLRTAAAAHGASLSESA